MIESLVDFLSSLPPVGIVVFSFFIAYLENIFPPSPSDILIVFCGTLVGIGTVDFASVAIASTLGGCAGFCTMYILGRKFGDTITTSPKFSFLPISALNKAEEWFRKYGNWVIVVNRFLSGTRAVISLFAGISKLNFTRTLILSAISALVWNSLLITGGLLLGERWRVINDYLAMYSQFITPTLVLIALFFIGKYYYKKWKKV